MTTSFELLLLQEKIQDPKGERTQLAFQTLPEVGKLLDSLLEPFHKNIFSLFRDINKIFRRISFWLWAIILMDREYRLARHVFITRNRRFDVLLSGYSVSPGHLVKKADLLGCQCSFFEINQWHPRWHKKARCFPAAGQCWKTNQKISTGFVKQNHCRRAGYRKLKKRTMFYFPRYILPSHCFSAGWLRQYGQVDFLAGIADYFPHH